jgi:hypothetical protein
MFFRIFSGLAHLWTAIFSSMSISPSNTTLCRPRNVWFPRPTRHSVVHRRHSVVQKFTFSSKYVILSSVGRPSLWITERKEIPPSPLSFLLSLTSRKNSRDSALPNGSASFWPEIRDFGGIHSLPGAKFVSQSRVFSVNLVNNFLFAELILVSCVLACSWRVVVCGGF